MQSVLLGMLAETSIHPGSGQDAGFVDLPVAREAATDYPVIVGSSMKGALLDRARQVGPSGEVTMDEGVRNLIFGKHESAGQLLVGDARLLLLPVRSLHGSYRWVTCPQLLRRLHRDLLRAEIAIGKEIAIPSIQQSVCLASKEAVPDGNALLEERQFGVVSEPPPEAFDLLANVLPESVNDLLRTQLVILSDNDFAWFARYGLAVHARNQLHTEKKTSENLWYEETLPPDSVFTCLISGRSHNAVESLMTMFASRPFLQVGGNETVGQGWFQIKAILSPVTTGAKV